MKRFCIFFLLAAAFALSCSPESLSPCRTPGEGDQVTVTFKVRGAAPLPTTRALGETTELETLHLAVFGSSLYLKEYVEAILTGSEDFTYHYRNDLGVEQVATVKQYSFSAKLTMSDSKRTIHFIGNGPSLLDFGLPSKVLPGLLSEKETAYWAMIELPDGIRGKRYEDGEQKGEFMVDINGDYVPDDDLVAAFSPTDALGNTGIPLVRNWAKIELSASEGSHFTPISFAVTNVPSQGTIVPYCSKGFLQDYYQKSFNELHEYGYLGNLPPGVTFDKSVPSKQDFIDGTNGAVLVSNANAAVYLYERPAPDNVIEPSFVIIYGTYLNPDDVNLTEEERTNGVKCFYKVDLMSDGEYYPIYRNFKYRVVVDKITARGHDNPLSAANSAGSADVSADVSASHLADISDGVRRLAIQHWMAKTFTQAVAQQHQISAIFYDDVTVDNPAPNLDPGAVTYLLIPANGGVIENVEIKEPGSDGWRDIWFSVGSLDAPVPEVPRTQTLRIIATSGTDRLWRDIVVTLQGIQDMQVKCQNSRVSRARGKEQALDISIPDGLPESMFPLIFMIEPENMTLTPDISQSNNELPVEPGLSLSGSGKPSFHFLRTLTWEDYNEITPKQDDDQAWWRTFSSYFKTNCMLSATTIWVEDKGGYFKRASDYFSNFKAFENLKFTTSIPREVNAPVTASFSVSPEHDGSYETIWFRLKNLVPDGSWGERDAYTGHYYYTPTSDNQVLTFLTQSDDGDVEINISTEGDTYDPARLTPWRFRNFALGAPRRIIGDSNYMSNVALGHVNNAADKRVMMGFYLSPDATDKKPAILLKNLVGVSLIGSESQTPADLGKTAQPYYVERRVKTQKSDAPISVTLSSVGYVEEIINASRFDGDIRTYELNKSSIKAFVPGNNPSFSVKNPYVQFKKDGFTTRVEFSQIKDLDDRGVVLEAGGSYTMKVTLSGISDTRHHLYYVQIGYVTDEADGKPMVPLWAAPVEPTEENGAKYVPYPGNNYQYEWHFPEGTLSSELSIRAPGNKDVVINEIVIKVFDYASKRGFLP